MPLNWESELEFESVKEVSQCCWRIAACLLEVHACLKVENKGIIKEMFFKVPRQFGFSLCESALFMGNICIKQTISSALT